MIVLCPRCGAEFPTRYLGGAFETDPKCSECGVATAAPPAMLAPSADEVTYGLDEWPVADRTILTEALAGDDIPYRWESGMVLVVPDAVEAVVDGLLDDLERSEEAATAGDGLVDDDLVADGGVEAQAAMSDLFVAADRLHHSPSDIDLADQLSVVADVVAASLPPYGIDEATWRRIHELAVAAGDGADDLATAESAAALRDFLRQYV